MDVRWEAPTLLMHWLRLLGGGCITIPQCPIAGHSSRRHERRLAIHVHALLHTLLFDGEVFCSHLRTWDSLHNSERE